ncbi:hypothetical protein TWF694_011342 [Orbilia ellipsospora]|uniref:Uncharacterized protein n=1 Tax=Orbilia ellipsospora TaxID=2528407 RepID=A0AAV9X4Z1_9PEZI
MHTFNKLPVLRSIKMSGIALIVDSFGKSMYRLLKTATKVGAWIFLIAGLLELLLLIGLTHGICSKLCSSGINVPLIQNSLFFLLDHKLSPKIGLWLLLSGFLLKWLDLFIDWCGTDYFDILDRLYKAKESNLRPRFFFCTSRHLRLSPNRYFFQYPILYVGFSTKFLASIGSLFSVKESIDELENPDGNIRQHPRWFTFFSVNPKAYMSSDFGFDKKARRFLRSNDVDDARYPHIYVVTAPNILPWEFNPVTYYYVYDTEMELRYTILEVNNTFQESHAYLLPREGSKIKNERYLYTHRFPKGFHISPFNKRSGEYEADILDPIKEERFEVKIAVLDEVGKRRMTVQTLSLGKYLDMLEASWVDILKLILRWMFCGSLVVPRTLWQCWRIFCLEHTEIHGRPEPFQSSKGRSASGLEQKCQGIFLQFIKHRVWHYHLPVKIIVTLPRTDIGVLPKTYEFLPQNTTNGASEHPELTINIQVKNNIFWSKVLSCITMSELRYTELWELEPEMRSVEVSDWDLLVDILNNHTRPEEPTERTDRNNGAFSILRGIWLQGFFFWTSIMFQRVHGEALETSPVYLYYSLEPSPRTHPPLGPELSPLQNFGSYKSIMGSVTRNLASQTIIRKGFNFVKQLGWDLYWLPEQ